MADKQYEGVFIDHIASLDRLAKHHQDNIELLTDIYDERTLVVRKLGYEVDDNGFYSQVK